jgi:hypothetical protein
MINIDELAGRAKWVAGGGYTFNDAKELSEYTNAIIDKCSALIVEMAISSDSITDYPFGKIEYSTLKEAADALEELKVIL